MYLKKIARLSVLLLFFSCAGGKDDHVPSVAVNFTASLSDPSLNSLNNPGGVVLIQGHGVAGLIISRYVDNTYVAFDQCSSVNAAKKCAVKPDYSGLTATDPCSGAKFSLFDGAAVKAPAIHPLIQYKVYTDQFSIHVRN